VELSLARSLFVSSFYVLLRICWCPDKRMCVHTPNNAPTGAWGKVLGRLWERRVPHWLGPRDRRRDGRANGGAPRVRPDADVRVQLGAGHGGSK
jgi:hypothetical protein